MKQMFVVWPKDTGQRAPTPPAALKKVADSSDSWEEDKDDKSRSNKNKVSYLMFLADKYSSEKQKKNIVFEYYDTSDPFIDDSELVIDERQFFAQTEQQGFYVSSGDVALLKDKYVLLTTHTDLSSTFFFHALQKSLHKEKKKPQQQVFEGTKETPITIDATIGAD